MSAPQVQTGIGLPAEAPKDWESLAGFLTQQNNALQQWVGAAAIILNSVHGLTPGGYVMTVNGAGNLIITGPLGTQTTIATP